MSCHGRVEHDETSIVHAFYCIVAECHCQHGRHPAFRDGGESTATCSVEARRHWEWSRGTSPLHNIKVEYLVRFFRPLSESLSFRLLGRYCHDTWSSRYHNVAAVCRCQNTSYEVAKSFSHKHKVKSPQLICCIMLVDSCVTDMCRLAHASQDLSSYRLDSGISAIAPEKSGRERASKHD